MYIYKYKMFCNISFLWEVCVLHNFSVRESLFNVTPCRSIHVHSEPQSMIACYNICFVISILQIKVRDGRGGGGKHF